MKIAFHAKVIFSIGHLVIRALYFSESVFDSRLSLSIIFGLLASASVWNLDKIEPVVFELIHI